MVVMAHDYKTPASTGKSKGFTLIEVIITVAIIGLLASIAYPQYGSYVQKTRRADAQLALLQEVQSMERCKSTSYSYANCALTDTNSPESHYAITLTTAAASYTLTATGQGAQATDPDCKVMTINHQGIRSPDPDTSDCWPS